MSKLKDLTGKKFGRLIVIERSGSNKDGRAMWLCQCECGNTTVVMGKCLVSGHTTSCGCSHTKQSRLTIQYPRLYKIWNSMKQRCYDTHLKHYNNYGGRGIAVCSEWHDFKNFVKWSLGNGYNDTLTIDRVDSNDHYSPNNCRWVDMKTQGNNKRNNHLITYKGETLTVKLMSEKYHIPYYTLLSRINTYGWSVEKAIETPIQIHKKKH